jgi:hypothetical protein
MELRGHEHVVEIAVFTPQVANAAIREMAGIPVSSLPSFFFFFFFLTCILMCSFLGRGTQGTNNARLQVQGT